jgi:hypothetical protein
MSLANQTGLLGVTNDAASADIRFPLGTVVIMGNTSYTYAQASAAIAAAGTVALTAPFGTTTGTTYTHDVAAPGVPISQYFWAKKVVSPF